MSMKKKVLIVEDDELDWFVDWSYMFKDKVELIFATSIEEAEEQFSANPDITAIVMDACVPGIIPTTPPLVRKFRQVFKGPMFAISSDPEYRTQLVNAGCDHECTKAIMPTKVLEVLGL